MACSRYKDVNTVYVTVLYIVHAITAACMEDFNRSFSYTLPCFECTSMTLKLEQRASVKSIYEEKDLFLWLPTGKQSCYKVLPFVFDVKLGRLTENSTNRSQVQREASMSQYSYSKYSARTLLYTSTNCDGVP